MSKEQESKIKQMFALAMDDDRLVKDYVTVEIKPPDTISTVVIKAVSGKFTYTMLRNIDNDTVWLIYQHVCESEHAHVIYSIHKVIALIDEIIEEE